jgi:hypothetical protein
VVEVFFSVRDDGSGRNVSWTREGTAVVNRAGKFEFKKNYARSFDKKYIGVEALVRVPCPPGLPLNIGTLLPPCGDIRSGAIQTPPVR